MAEVSSRTEKVLITPQGIILKKLRENSGLSMEQAGKAMAVFRESHKAFSATYISQVENHRTAPPKGESLEAFLQTYKTSLKHYQKLCRNWKNKLTDDDVIRDSLSVLSTDDKKYIRQWIEDRIGKKF